MEYSGLLTKGQAVLLFRVNLNVKKDSIICHKKTLEQYGYCWFGKIGQCPLKSKIDIIIKQDSPKIILYTKKELILCDIDSVLYERPSDGYPDYYQRDFFDKGINISCYFRILTMKTIPDEELQKLYIISTAKTASETLPTSKATFLFLMYDQVPTIIRKTRSIRSKKLITSNNRFCKYREGNTCKNKRSVNYIYECLHPDVCIHRHC